MLATGTFAFVRPQEKIFGNIENTVGKKMEQKCVSNQTWAERPVLPLLEDMTRSRVWNCWWTEQEEVLSVEIRIEEVKSNDFNDFNF